MMHGFNPCVIWVLPMLGKHPEEYPRFRDCFVGDKEHPEYKDHILVYTRTGGNNRDCYEEANQAMRDMEGFVTDYDDSFDNTFASWVFKVPEKWQKDFEAFKQGRLKDLSPEYQDRIKQIYPKIADKIEERLQE